MTEPLLTKRLIKDLASLDTPKGRKRTGLFVAEGTKCVCDLLPAFRPRHIFSGKEWAEQHPDVKTTIVGGPELSLLTRLQNTPPVIAFFELPEISGDCLPKADKLVLALDTIQDPGNLGTIIRTCDWMGVKTIVASHETVDAFNPKTVQATMGALARVKIIYTSLELFLTSLPPSTPIYGTFLDGANIYTEKLETSGVLIMGNEGRGISPEIENKVNRRLTIPSWPPFEPTSESLNVATATAIALSQFRSRQF